MIRRALLDEAGSAARRQPAKGGGGQAGVHLLTTAVLPVILIAVGIADEIHLLSRYRQLLAAGAVGLSPGARPLPLYNPRMPPQEQNQTMARLVLTRALRETA